MKPMLVGKIKPFSRIKVWLKAINIELNFRWNKYFLGASPEIISRAYCAKKEELYKLKDIDIHLAAYDLTKAQFKVAKGKKKVVLWQYAMKVYRNSKENVVITDIDSEEE